MSPPKNKLKITWSYLTVPSGNKLKISCYYDVGEVSITVADHDGNRRVMSKIMVHTRRTTILVEILDLQAKPDEEAKAIAAFRGESNCSPFDQFSKMVGKKVALRKLFDQDKDHLLAKTDRRAIVQKLLPKLFRKENL